MAIDGLLNQLDGLDKPEKRIKIKVTEDPDMLLYQAFAMWYQYALKVVDKGSPYEIEQYIGILYQEAERILRPYQEKLPVLIYQSQLHLNVLYDIRMKNYLGLFSIALLNIGTTEKTIVVKDILEPPHMHHRFGIKKVTVIIPETEVIPSVGFYMQDGLVVNHGWIYDSAGAYSQNSIFINHGSIYSLGESATDGVFIDYTGENPKKQSYRLNIGQFAKKSQIIAPYAENYPYYSFGEETRNLDKHTYIKEDKKLMVLLMELKRKTITQTINSARVKEIVAVSKQNYPYYHK